MGGIVFWLREYFTELQRELGRDAMKISLILKTAVMLPVALGLLWLAPPSASAAGLGQFCGGFAGIKCNRGLFCDFPAPFCGAFDRSGTCARIPTVCFKIFRPVCGCNGK